MVVYALDGRKGDGAILSKDKAVRGRGVEPLDYSVNGNTIHYNADESKTASRNFDNALGAIGHFSYRPKSRTYNREGATFNAPIKHTLILKSRKK